MTESRPGCPHPEKIAHRSKRAAAKAERSMEKKAGPDLTLRPYLCACGAWHLGHGGSKSMERQLAKALGAGRRNAWASRKRRKR